MKALRVSAVLLLLLSPASIFAGPPLSHYTIFAEEKVFIGGGSFIQGLVGCSFVGTTASQRAVTLNAGADIQGDVRSSWHVQLNNGCFVYGTVTHPAGTTITMGNPAGVNSDVVGDPEPPSLPAPTLFASGGTSYTGLGNGATLVLAPGSYGDLQCGGGCTFTLSAGDYYFDSISTGNGLDLRIGLGGGQTNIYVTGRASFGSVDVFLINGGVPEDVYLESAWTGTGTLPAAFKAGGGSDWIGDVFAPNGDIHFGGGSCCSSFQGRFWSGKTVDIEHGVTGESPVPVQATSWGLLKGDYRD